MSSEDKEMTGYSLSRDWFNFCFENPEKISPNHTALYFFAIEHCNRLGWKKKFGFPTTMAMEAIGIKSYNTYKKVIMDLVKFGFIKMIEKSKNQYSSNIIALSNFDKAPDKALDKALIKHGTKQVQSTVQSNDSIYKQRTIEQGTNKQENNARENIRKTLNGFGKPLMAMELFNREGFTESFLDYWVSRKNNYNQWPHEVSVMECYRRLEELRVAGNDPIKVLRQTMRSGGKELYEVRDDKYSSSQANEPIPQYLTRVL